MATVGSVLFNVKKSWRGFLVAGGLALLPGLVSPSAAASFQATANDSSLQSASSDPRALYQTLNALRPDGEHVYTVHELNLRRDVVNVRLVGGKLAFFQPIDGHVTGAVFSGRGHIFATPRERGEGHSIARCLGGPVGGQGFRGGCFRLGV